MKKVFEGLESIESGLYIHYAVLSDANTGEKIALIRATKDDFLKFTRELDEKIKAAIFEHFCIDCEEADSYGVDRLSLDTVSGISTLLCGYNNKKYDTNLTLTALPLY